MHVHLRFHIIAIIRNPKFPWGVDYTLSSIGLVRSSFATRYRLVSGPSPYSTNLCSFHNTETSLGAWLRIPDFAAVATATNNSSTTFFLYLQSFSGASGAFRHPLRSSGFTDFPNSLEALPVISFSEILLLFLLEPPQTRIFQ